MAPQDSTVLITGSNRGLGLALVRHYVKENWQVIATYRTRSSELNELSSHPKVRLESLDVSDEDSINKLSKRLHGLSIDVLINNAGIYGVTPTPLSEVNADDFMRCLQVNSLGPLLVSRALAHNVSLSSRRIIVNISSRLGSIGANDWGSWYIYGTSKTVLNRVSVQLASTLSDRGIIVTAVHPGWVETEMGGAGAPVTASQSAEGIFNVAQSLKFEDSGTFRDFTGAPWPW